MSLEQFSESRTSTGLLLSIVPSDFDEDSFDAPVAPVADKPAALEVMPEPVRAVDVPTRIQAPIAGPEFLPDPMTDTSDLPEDLFAAAAAELEARAPSTPAPREPEVERSNRTPPPSAARTALLSVPPAPARTEPPAQSSGGAGLIVAAGGGMLVGGGMVAVIGTVVAVLALVGAAGVAGWLLVSVPTLPAPEGADVVSVTPTTDPSASGSPQLPDAPTDPVAAPAAPAGRVAAAPTDRAAAPAAGAEPAPAAAGGTPAAPAPAAPTAPAKTEAKLVLTFADGTETPLTLGKVDGTCTEKAPVPIGPEGMQQTPLWMVSCVDAGGKSSELAIAQVSDQLTVLKALTAPTGKVDYKPIKRIKLAAGATVKKKI